MNHTCTINTDASYSNETGRGGWSVWIVCDEYRIREFGAFSKYMDNVQSAECAAVCNAIQMVLNRNVKFYKVVINCDNMQVINMVNRKITLEKVPPSKLLQELIKKLNCKVYAKHVKGHSSGSTARCFVNNWCDKKSKEYKKQQ